MKRITMLLYFLLFTLYGNTQEINKNYDEAFKLIEAWLEAQKDFESIPGMVAMVVEDQEVLWTGAFGKSNLEQDNAMDVNTICSICSITKSFTAVAIMKLIDEELGGTTPLEIILKFPFIQKSEPDSNDDEFDIADVKHDDDPHIIVN